MTDDTSPVEIAGAVVVAAALLSLALTTAAANTAARDSAYHDRAERWCSARDGELVHRHGLGTHAGWYCRLPSGATVAMRAVVPTPTVFGGAVPT